MNDSLVLQVVLPQTKGNLSVSTARLLAKALFLAFSVGAESTLQENLDLKHEVGTYKMH